MKRRETLKSLLIGGIAGATITTTGGCKIENYETEIPSDEKFYGRTPAEIEHDEKSWLNNTSMKKS